MPYSHKTRHHPDRDLAVDLAVIVTAITMTALLLIVAGRIGGVL